MMREFMIAFLIAAVALAGYVFAISDSKVYNPVDYGAEPDGKSICTVAIQKAIDECSANGGGVVRLSGGKFLSGTIFMKSRVTLEITEGSTLLGSTDLSLYPVTITAFRSYTDNYTDKSLIYGESLTHIAITGKGTIDGQGASFWTKEKAYKKRPYGIRFVTCKNIRIEDITLRNSAMWMQHYLACEDVSIRYITVWNHSNKNNDGINIDGCRNVLVEGCRIDSDDDGICLKSTSDRSCDKVIIKNCVVSTHCNAFKCGTESNGGFKNIKISDCTIKPSSRRSHIYGLPDGYAGIALEIVDGGTMDNVTVSDIQIHKTRAPIFIRLGNRARRFKKDMPLPGVGKLRNVTISDIKATETSDMGCAIAGLKDHPIENLTLRNITISFPGGGKKEHIQRRFDEKSSNYPECTMFSDFLPAYGFFFWHVKGITLEDVRLIAEEPEERPAIVFEDASNVRIDGETLDKSKAVPEGVLVVPDQQIAPVDAE